VPVLSNSATLKSPFWLKGAHAQSIFPALFRKVDLSNPRLERLTLPDDDFLDVDWYVQGDSLGDKPLLIVSHGLEGNSQRPYVKGLVKSFLELGVNAMAWNYRSCSGEPNKALRFYHSGATDDLDFVIQHAIQQGAKEIYLAGFSLGGNLTLKWLGEKGENPPKSIRKAVAFSVPLHLSSSSRTLARWDNGIYTSRFLQTLIEKVKEKSARYPLDITPAMLSSIRSLFDFDDVITGPLHGFKDAEDYYEKSSSLYFIDKIRIPTLIINAKNDPFLSPECFPESLVSTLEHVFLEIPQEGGHCGFYPSSYQGQLWSEKRAVNWLM
jgi:predicted alpha/beta-fold hydrolase